MADNIWQIATDAEINEELQEYLSSQPPIPSGNFLAENYLNLLTKANPWWHHILRWKL